MNNYIQVALGILPALIFIILYLAIKKKQKTKCIITIICFGIAFSLCLFKGVMALVINHKPLLAEQNKLKIAYSLVLNKSDLADSTLKEYTQANSYTDDISLFNARKYALDGDYKAAKVLYEKALRGNHKSDIYDEYELTLVAYNATYPTEELDNYETIDDEGENTSNSSTSNDKSDNKQSSNNDSKENNQETNKTNGTNKTDEAVDIDDIEKQLKDKIENQLGVDSDELYTRVAKYIKNAEQLYNKYLQSGEKDEQNVNKLLKKLNNVEEEVPQIKQSDTFKLAKLKMLILDEDYEQIAESIDKYSSYDELLIVSELYINGYIKGSNFSDELIGNKNVAYNNVINQLESVYDSNYQDESRSVRDNAKECIKSIKLAQKNIALAAVRDNLASQVETCDSNNTTKVYLQLSKVENYLNNSDKANEYIEKSISTVDTCSDDSFTQPMYQVIGIMTTNDNPERLKDVATYVDKITSNTTTIQMADELTKSKGNNDEDNGEEEITFNNYMSDYVSKKCAAINIINIDKTKFPLINAKIAFDSDTTIDEKAILEQLAVADCDDVIDNFKLEKMSYSKANILLCCDLSGSMSGDVDNLKNAVNMFIDNKLSDENIAMLTFNGQVIDTYQFGTADDELKQATESFNADDGTNIFEAVISSINMFSDDKDALNVIILMSDGQDNYSRSESEIRQAIGEACATKNIQLYSLGLGSGVDASYLSYIANCTGGSYLYVNNSSSLKTFYEYVHNQYINQYNLSYTAKDTLTNQRDLRVNMKKDNTYDIIYYSLLDEEPDDNNSSENNDDDDIITLNGKSIYGLDTRLIYKSNNDTLVNLKGTGFKQDDKLIARIQAGLTYDIQCKYINETTIQLTIPKNVCPDTYDLYITIGSNKATLDRELTVAVIGSEKKTEFGPYKFVSYSKVIDGDKITLSGNVCLNGWLTFNGDVVLQGDLTSSSIVMTDNYGSRINYYEKTSQGFAKILAKNSFTLPIPSMINVTLYNDTAHYMVNGIYEKEYSTDKIIVPSIYINDLLVMTTPLVRLYPDRFLIDIDGFSTKLPLQDKILHSPKKNIFNFEQKAFDIVLTNKEIGMNLYVKFGNDKDAYTPILSNLGNAPIYISPNFEIKIDTISNKYSFKFLTKIGFVNLDSVGLSLQWWDRTNSYEQTSIKSKLTPYEVRLYADFPINTTIGGLPVTFHDFELAASQIDVDKPIYQWCLEGKTTAEAMKLDAYLPGIKKYLGDISIFSFRDATVKFRLSNPYLKLSTDFCLLKNIKLVQAEMEFGNFKYTNSWLKMDREDVIGMRAKMTQGIDWHADRCDVEITGSTELAVMNKFIGVLCSGKYNIDINWWVLSKVIEKEGDVIIGLYTDHSDETYFMIFANYYDRNDKSKPTLITWAKNDGIDITHSSL